MTTVRDLDRTIQSRHLLKHPFYQAWAQGRVSLPTLRSYAGQYYQFESNFPRFVAAAYARLPSPSDRQSLLENLVDEEGRQPTHPQLWLDFASSLGMKERQVRAAAPSLYTQRLLKTYERWAVRGTAASALGSLYAYESIFPEIASEKSRGLSEHYGIRSKAAHEFFRVHTTADVAHSAAERTLLSKAMAASPKAAEDARKAVDETSQAWWRFLDGFPV
ncbi:MAG: CADD family putative folate metabolism protein [Solirubrobacterales bacterium]|nr:CADD family putative folate metabolism protein [Thermoplasmata archaeon]